jgi:hypothetical protein
MREIPGIADDQMSTDVRGRLMERIKADDRRVWTPGDVADLGGRAAVDKTLQRLVASGELRRVDRGLYHFIRERRSVGAEPALSHHAIIEAVTRRDRARFVVDGATAASDLGIVTAKPVRIEVLVDARLHPVHFDGQEIYFKSAAPRRLYWAGRPAMLVVQALYWAHDSLRDLNERTRIENILRGLFADPTQGQLLCSDLRDGLSALPIWMQEFLRELLCIDRKGNVVGAPSSTDSQADPTPLSAHHGG